MKERKFILGDNYSYVILRENGNTYFGELGTRLMRIFDQNNISDYESQLDVMAFALANDRAKEVEP